MRNDNAKIGNMNLSNPTFLIFEEIESFIKYVYNWNFIRLMIYRK